MNSKEKQFFGLKSKINFLVDADGKNKMRNVDEQNKKAKEVNKKMLLNTRDIKTFLMFYLMKN